MLEKGTRIYIVYAASMPLVRQKVVHDYVIERYCFGTREAAWYAHRHNYTTAENEPWAYIVVGAVLTGARNAQGAYVVEVDWRSAFPCVLL